MESGLPPRVWTVGLACYDGFCVNKNSKKEYLQICKKKKKTEKVISFWCEASLRVDVKGRMVN